MASELSSPRPKSGNDVISSEEINLNNVFLFLKEGRKVICTAIILGLLGSVIYLLFVKPTFTATANIQMATVSGKAIEEPDALAEKIKIPSYFSPEAIAECKSETGNWSPESFSKEIKVVLYRKAPILGLSFGAREPAAAQACVNAIYKNVQSNQQALIQPIIDVKTAQVTRLRKKVEEIEKATKEFGKNYSERKDYGATDLWFAITTANDKDIQALLTQINDLELALAPPQTMSTHLVTPSYVLDARPARRILLALTLGLSAGLFLGIALLLLENLSRRLRDQEAV